MKNIRHSQRKRVREEETNNNDYDDNNNVIMKHVGTKWNRSFQDENNNNK